MTDVLLPWIISIFGTSFHNILIIYRLTLFLQDCKFQDSKLKGVSAIICNIFANQEKDISLFLIKKAIQTQK